MVTIGAAPERRSDRARSLAMKVRPTTLDAACPLTCSIALRHHRGWLLVRAGTDIRTGSGTGRAARRTSRPRYFGAPTALRTSAPRPAAARCWLGA